MKKNTAMTPKPANYALTLLRGGRLTKVNGVATSHAPQLGGVGGLLKPLALAVGLAVGGAFTAVPNAMAGSCTQSPPGTWNCSDPAVPAPGTDTTQTLDAPSGTPLTVTTTPGFGINTASGDALVMRSDQATSINFTDINASSITAEGTGINASLDFSFTSTGEIEITTNGDITGTDGAGINAFNAMGGVTIDAKGTVISTSGSAIQASNFFGSVIVNANETRGYYSGIQATNEGKDLLRVTSTGTASGTGANSIGIRAENISGNNGATLDANHSNGGNTGIYFRSAGGNNRITTTGTTTGTTNFGINARSSGSSLEITTRGDTTGGIDGIRASNYGGELTITSTRTTIGSSGSGIHASNLRYKDYYGNYVADPVPTSLTITAAETLGGESGINAVNKGTGALSITTTGAITGTEFFGISAFNYGTGALTATTLNINSGSVVQGGTAGINAQHHSASAFTINIDGEVRNASGIASDLAIKSTSTQTGLNINNNGLVTGTVDFGNTPTGNIFNNNISGIWNTAGGSNDFDNTNPAVSNNVINNQGTIFAANVGAPGAVTTTFNNLGSFNNLAGGQLRMDNGIAGDVTVLTGTSGNFAGAGGITLIDTELGDDSSLTDTLQIGGDSTGSSLLSVNNVGGAGAVTGVGIRVIDVEGTSSGTFALAAPVTTGLFTYTLKQGGNGGDAEDWYLMGSNITAVPTYALGQYANMQAGLMQVGTLHQRMGEQRHAQGEHPQLWMRLLGDKDRASGSADWSYTQSSYGLQLGVDLINRTSTAQGSQSSNQRAGLTLAYRDSRADFKDKTRSIAGLGSDSGQLSSSQLTLGAYYTDMAQDGSYLDLVGNIGQLRNRYNNIDTGQATQRGWQAQLSAEVGKPIYQSQSGWQLEPQAQLIYQHTRYRGFSDSQFAVGRYSSDQLRGRVGLRLFKDGGNQGQPNNVYLIANLTHDFMKADPISIDNTPVGQSYDRTRAEIGLGVQSKFSKTGYFYADARYSKSLRGHSEGGQANVGVKVAW